MFNFPFFNYPYNYQYYNHYKKYNNYYKNNYSNENTATNCKDNTQNNSITNSNQISNTINCQNYSNYDEPIWEIFGINIYLDDLIILGLLFFLYQQNVDDQMLYIILLFT